MPTEEELKAAKDAEAAAAAAKAKDGEKQYTNAQLAQAVRFLGGEMKKLQDKNAALEEKLSTTQATRKADPDGGKGKTDVEVMSNSELAEHIVAKVGEVYKPYLDRLDTLETTRGVDRAQADIGRLAEDDPDFWKYQEELKLVIKKHPDLSVEEAYVLAKTVDPDKTKQLTTEREVAARKEADEKAAKEKVHFGGLLPTSGKSTKQESMKIDDAAETAWKDLGVSEHLRAVSPN